MSTVDDARYTRIIHCRLCCNLQLLNFRNKTYDDDFQ